MALKKDKDERLIAEQKKSAAKQSAAKSSGSSGSSSSAKKKTGSAPANAYSDSGSYQRAQTAKQNRTTGSSQGSGSGGQRSGSGSSYSGSGVKKSTSGAPSVTNYRTDASSSAYNNDGSRKSSYGSSSSGTGSGGYTYGASKQNRELSLERAEHIDVQKRESSVRRRAENNRRDQALRDQGIDPDDLRRQMAEYLNERDGGRGSTRIKASYETNINSIIKSLSSDSYKDSDDIKKLQDTYAQAQTELNKLKVRGYDVTEAQEQLTQLQKAMREQISYNSTFKNKDDYTISRLAAANSGKGYREIQEQIDQRSRQLGNQGTNVSAENLRDMQRELNWLEQNKYNYMTGNELLSELTKTYEERATEAPNLKERFITGDVSKHTGDRADYDYKIERLKEAISKNVDTGSLPARLWSESDISHNGVTSASDRLKYAESEYERFVSGLKLQRSDDEKLRKLLADHKTYTYTDGDGNVKTGRAKDLIKEYVARQDYQEGSALNRVFSGGMTGEVTPQFINATNSIVSSLSNAGYNVTAMASAYERYRNEKEAEEREKAIREYVSSGKPLAKTLASAATVATNLAAPAVAALGTLGRAATAGAYDNTRKLADVNDEAFAASRFTSDVRDEVEKQLTAKAKTGFGKAVRSIVYSAGMSLADMAAAFLVAGGIQLGGGATLAELKTEGSAARKAMGRLVQTFMSSSAGTGEFIDSIQNGATMGQAVRTGIAAAVFEAVFEKYSIGMIADAMKATNPIQILTKMCMSFVGEGSEEVATDVANMLADAFINGDNSKFNRSVVEYMKNGDSAATAKAKALADTRKQLWQSFAGGALAGAAGTGITAANAVYYSAREANSKIKADIDTGRDAARAQSGVRSSENAGQTIENLRELTGEAKLSEKEQKKISRDIRKAEKAQAKIGSREQDGKKKTVTKKSAYDIGKAVNDVREASAESAVSQIRRDAIANRISALDRDGKLSSQDVDTLTAAVYEAYVDEKSGKRTSRENISLITNSPAATTVRNELRSAESQRASQWIQDMREAENAARDEISERAESGARSAEIQPVGEFAARTSNGEAVTVTAVESTRDGIRVRLSDGTNGIVSSTAHRAVNGQQRDIFFDNEEDERLFTAAAKAGGAAEANAFIAAYQPGVDIDQYTREWNEAYAAGLLGNEQRTANSEQQAAAYQAAVERRESGRIDPTEIAGQIVAAAGNAAGVTVLSKGGMQTLSEADRQTLRLADAYGKAHGIRYIVVDTVGAGGANALYAGGNVVFVAADTGNADGGMSAAIGHDTWHYITETIRQSGDENAEQYITDKTAELLGLLDGLPGYDLNTRRENLIDANRKLGEDLDEDRLNEELVGNGMFELITNDEAVKALVESDAKTGDNFVQKLKEAFEAVVQRIRNAAARYGVAEARALVKAEEALAKFNEVANEAVRLADAARANSDQGSGISDQTGSRFMIREEVTADDGKTYENVVFLDSDVLKNTNRHNRNKVFTDYVRNNFAGVSIPVYNENGEQEIISFAKKNERVLKDGATNKHKVLDKLATKRKPVEMSVVLNSEEVLQTSRENGGSDDHSHQWLDQNGWKFRTAYVQTSDGKLYAVNLNIAQARDGRNIFYDVNDTKKIGVGNVPSSPEQNSGRSRRATTTDYEGSVSQPTENVNTSDMKFMARETEDSLRQERDRLNEEQTELNKKIEALKASDEYNSLVDRTVKQEDGALEAYVKWINESGLNDAVRKQTENEKRIESLNKQIDDLYSENATRKEQEAIQKSGLSEGDYFRKAAVKEFGYTPYFYDAGYLLPNGKMLNFSGEKGQHFGTRGEDHRGIGAIFEDTTGTDAMIRFMNQGNIRVMAETPGIDIYSGAEPTNEQYYMIKKMAKEYSGETYFSVDFSDENGSNIGSLEYENKINPDRIVNDIKHYFATGELREQSGVDRFRYMAREDYDQDITLNDIKKVQRMFPDRKSIMKFSQEEIDATAKWAYRFYKLMGPKSPYFRAGLGDWRAHDTSKKNLAYVVKFESGEISEIREESRSIRNKDSKFDIKIDRTVFGDSDHYSRKHGDKDKVFKLLSKIDEIAEKAIYLETKTIKKSKNKKGSAVFMHYLYCPVTFNDAPFIAKLEVEEYSTDGKTTAYNLQRIKMSGFQRASFLSLLEENRKSYALQSDFLNVAQLYRFVKKYDEDFTPGRGVNPVFLNEDGTPKIFYHGTPNGTFTVFKNWQYFTENKRYADQYQNQAIKRTADNPTTYPVYITSEKTFDTRNADARRIFEEEFFGKWGNGTPLSERGLPDWTDADDLIEFLEENGYDYDAVIIDEGSEDRGISIAVKNPNQIKSAETGTDRANIGTFSRYENDYQFMARESDYYLPEDEEETPYNGEKDFRLTERYREALTGMGYDRTDDQIVRLDPESEAEENRGNVPAYNKYPPRDEYTRRAMDRISKTSRPNPRDMEKVASSFDQAETNRMKADKEIAEILSALYRYASVGNEELSSDDYGQSLIDMAYMAAKAIVSVNSSYGAYMDGDPKGFYLDRFANDLLNDVLLINGNVIARGEFGMVPASELDNARREYESARKQDRKEIERLTRKNEETEKRFGEWAATEKKRDAQRRLDADKALREALRNNKKIERSRKGIKATSEKRRAELSATRKELDSETKRANRAERKAESAGRRADRAELEAKRRSEHYREKGKQRTAQFNQILKEQENRLRHETGEAVYNAVQAERRQAVRERATQKTLQNVTKLRKAVSNTRYEMPEAISSLTNTVLNMFDGNSLMMPEDLQHTVASVLTAVQELALPEDGDIYRGLINDITAATEAMSRMPQLYEMSAMAPRAYDETAAATNAEKYEDAVNTMVTATEHIVRRFNAQAKFMSKITQEVQKDIDTSKFGEKGKVRGALDQAGSMLNSFLRRAVMEEPYVARRIGGTFADLMDDFRRTGEKQYWDYVFGAQQKLNSLLDKYDARKYIDGKNKNPLKFTTHEGKALTLELTQAMGVYAVWLRERANVDENGKRRTAHLEAGGIMFTGGKMADGTRVPQSTGKFRLNDSDMRTIREFLDKDGRNMTGLVKETIRYMTDTVGEWGNKASLKMYGVRKFTDMMYYPFETVENTFIARDKADVSGEMSDGKKKTQKFSNMGMSKDVTADAMNPVKVNNFFDVVAGHINSVAAYGAYAEGQQNLLWILNYRTAGTETEAGSVFSEYLDDAYGRGTAAWVNKWLSDLSGGQEKDNAFGAKLFRSFKGAAVAANLSVTLKQPTSIGRALAYLGPQYFLGNPFNAGGIRTDRNAYNEAMKYSGAAKSKLAGGSFDINDGRSAAEFMLQKSGKRINNLQDATGFGARIADEVTWGNIWNACKRWTRKNMPALTGEEFMQATAQKFDEVVQLTQVYDEQMIKSELMRSQSFLAKNATMFMSEPMKQLNMLSDAFYQVQKNPKSANAWKYFARTNGALLIQALLTAAATGLVKVFRDRDEEKELPERFVAGVVDGAVDELNILSKIPFIKDLISMLQGYDVSRGDMELIADLITAVGDLADLLDPDSNTLAKLDAKAKAYKYADVISRTAGTMTSFFGLPVNNVYRDVMGLVRSAPKVLTIGNESAERLEWALKEGLRDAFTIHLGDKFERSAFDFLIPTAGEIGESLLAGDTKKAEEQMTELASYLAYTGDDKTTQTIRSKLYDLVKGYVENNMIDDDTARDYVYKYLAHKAKSDGTQQTYTEDEAYWLVKKWHFLKEHPDEQFKEYNDLDKAIDQKADLTDAINELTAHGFTETQAEQRVYNHLKNRFDNGEISADQARDLLEFYAEYAHNKKTTGKMAEFETQKNLGNLTEEEYNELLQRYGQDADYLDPLHYARQKVEEWSVKKETGSYSMYAELDEAIQSGKSTAKAVEHLEWLGVSDKSIESAASKGLNIAVNKYYAEQIAKTGTSDTQISAAAVKAGKYAEELYLKYVSDDKNEAWIRGITTEYKLNNPDETGSVSDYVRLDAAVESGKNIIKTVEEYLDHGKKINGIFGHEYDQYKKAVAAGDREAMDSIRSTLLQLSREYNYSSQKIIDNNLAKKRNGGS